MLVTLEGYNAKKIIKATKKVAQSPVTKFIDSLLTPVKKPSSVKTAVAVQQPQIVNTPAVVAAIENKILTADFLSDADKQAYLTRLEEIKQTAGSVIPKQIKATFQTGAGGKADYLYSLEKALAGLSGELNLGFGVKSIKKSVKKAVKTAKAVKKAAKPLTTIASKVVNNPAVQAAAMTNPYTATALTTYKAVKAGEASYDSGKDISTAVAETKQEINSSQEAKNAIINAAAEDAGVPVPETGLDQQSIEQMPAGDRAALADSLQKKQAEVIIKTEAKKEENAIDRIKAKDAQRQAEIKNEGPTTFTQEEIEEFNAGKGSYAERLASQGKLLGEELLEFWTVEPYQGQLRQAALLIFGSPRYPEMPYPSVEYVEKILTVYLSAVLKMSIAVNKNMFYNGTTSAEQKELLGNPFIKIVYMQMKGLVNASDVQAHFKEFDYNLRDMIWIILAQLKTLAAAPDYKKFLQPFDFIKKSGAAVKENIIAAGDNKKPLMIAAAALLALMIFKKGN